MAVCSFLKEILIAIVPSNDNWEILMWSSDMIHDMCVSLLWYLHDISGFIMIMTHDTCIRISMQKMVMLMICFPHTSPSDEVENTDYIIYLAQKQLVGGFNPIEKLCSSN